MLPVDSDGHRAKPLGLTEQGSRESAAIGTCIDRWNERCQPFTWTKTADELFPRYKPGKRTSFTRH